MLALKQLIRLIVGDEDLVGLLERREEAVLAPHNTVVNLHIHAVFVHHAALLMAELDVHDLLP